MEVVDVKLFDYLAKTPIFESLAQPLAISINAYHRKRLQGKYSARSIRGFAEFRLFLRATQWHCGDKTTAQK